MQKVFNVKSAVAAALFVPVAAFAELPTGVSTAITTGGTDGGTLMGLLAAAGAALYIVWKILKKAGIML
ncbi:hypothetical protein BURK2_01410 [Burkholderiales bacterium]|nr:hypothetical protein BURK2_01410 [Burkholderiales bacterium]